MSPSFIESNESNFESLNILIDIFFFIDILIAFRTTYVNEMNGDEISSNKEIAKNYINGRFMLDLLSAIPFEKLSRLF